MAKKTRTIFSKSSILDIWQGSQYASEWYEQIYHKVVPQSVCAYPVNIDQFNVNNRALGKGAKYVQSRL